MKALFFVYDTEVLRRIVTSIPPWLSKAVGLITVGAISVSPLTVCLCSARKQCKLFQLSLSKHTSLNLPHLTFRSKHTAFDTQEAHRLCAVGLRRVLSCLTFPHTHIRLITLCLSRRAFTEDPNLSFTADTVAEPGCLTSRELLYRGSSSLTALCGWIFEIVNLDIFILRLFRTY